MLVSFLKFGRLRRVRLYRTPQYRLNYFHLQLYMALRALQTKMHKSYKASIPQNPDFAKYFIEDIRILGQRHQDVDLVLEDFILYYDIRGLL